MLSSELSWDVVIAPERLVDAKNKGKMDRRSRMLWQNRDPLGMYLAFIEVAVMPCVVCCEDTRERIGFSLRRRRR